MVIRRTAYVVRGVGWGGERLGRSGGMSGSQAMAGATSRTKNARAIRVDGAGVYGKAPALALLERHEMQVARADILRLRANQAPAFAMLQDMRGPPGGAPDREGGTEQIGAEAEFS